MRLGRLLSSVSTATMTSFLPGCRARLSAASRAAKYASSILTHPLSLLLSPVVGIADSGSGKNQAQKIINKVFFDAGLVHHLGGNKIASGAGLSTALHRQPALLFQIDEFGMFLSAAANRTRSPRHITEILDNMTELYTSAGGIFLAAVYANRDGTNERRDFVQPSLSVYGITTPLHVGGALEGANVVDGSLAHFLILPSDDDCLDEKLWVGIQQTPPLLIHSFQIIATGGVHNQGNLAGKTAGTAVSPMIVPMTAQADARFQEPSLELTQELHASAVTAFKAIFARIGENACRIALIEAAGRHPAKRFFCFVFAFCFDFAGA